MDQTELKALESLAWRWEKRGHVGNDLGKVAAEAERKCAKELRAFLEKLPKEKPASPFCRGCNNPNCKDCFNYD